MTRDKYKTTKSGRRSWIIGSTIIIILFIVAIAGILRFFWVGSSNEIVSVANQFKPQPEWRLVSEHIEPPRTWCIDVECPSINRTWTLNHTITQQNLTEWAQKAGWEISFEDGCFERYSNGSQASSCWAHSTTREYSITLLADNNEHRPVITLTITSLDK